MKVLTLTQPWATLVAIGAKRIETRSWSTSYRGPLAIHAAAGLRSVGGWPGLWRLCSEPPFYQVLKDHFTAVELDKPRIQASELPTGAIVAVCELVAIVPTELINRAHGWYAPGNQNHFALTDQKRAFGNYALGRFAWLLADVRPLPVPIACKGALGLWNYNEELLQ